MEKMNGESLNIVADNIAKLKQIFPEVFNEGKVDFEKLEQVLGEYKDIGDERYSFTWPGKAQAIRIAQTPSTGTLRPCKEESVNWDETENLYIEGDNLEVLKLLQKSYYGKVKMIYIDPPYNTGNDFVYKDDFKDNISNYLQLTGQVDSEGRKISTNSEANGRYHTNWLNMMYPRLKLARNLLRQDGVIFISIDNNELSNLKTICDEIFGEENLVANIGLEITKTQGMKVKAAKEGSVVKNYEYVLCYAKQNYNKNIVENVLYDLNKGYDIHFSYYITKGEGGYKVEKLTDILEQKTEIKEKFDKLGLLKKGKIPLANIENAIYMSDDIKEYIYKNISKYIYQEMACNIKIPEEIQEALKYNDIVEYEGYLLTRSSGGKLRQYGCLDETLNYSDEYKEEYGRVTIRGDLWKGFYSDMMNVAKEGNVDFKNGKKPIRLIKQLAKWVGVKESDIVLDFFSGSATTAHAILQYNFEYGCKSRYILVQIPEPIEESEDVYKQGLVNICEVGKERIRRVGKTILDTMDKKVKLDIGFKVLKLDSSNVKVWDSSQNESIEAQLFNMINNIKEDRSEEDILYEILLKYGVDLNAPIEGKVLSNKKVYSIGFGAIIACLSENITLEVVEAIGRLKEELDPGTCRVVFKDSGFISDAVKTNAIQILKRYEIHEVKSI